MGFVENRLTELRSALSHVPNILLDSDLARGVEDATAAIDALAGLGSDPVIVVVSGAAGSGKSSVVNALIGKPLAGVSAVRPTTTSISAFGAPDFADVDGAETFVPTDALPSGVVVLDTPPWDRAQDAVGAVLDGATLAFVVVTPIRYGDEATAHNIKAASDAGEMRLIANRLPANPSEREQLEDAIHERLGIRPFATFSEGEAITFDESPLVGLDPVDNASATRRVLERAAAGSSRRIAASLTASASQLGKVQQALAEAPEPRVIVRTVATDSWQVARNELVLRAVDLADRFDASVIRISANDLAVRIRKSIGPVDADKIGTELDDWRDRVTSNLLDVARLGFRKKSSREMIIAHGWVAAVNADRPTPRRFSRMLKGSRDRVLGQAAADLTELLESQAHARQHEWHVILRTAGGYKPGELLTAAEAFEGLGRDA